jgi:hypothetical protein
MKKVFVLVSLAALVAALSVTAMGQDQKTTVVRAPATEKPGGLVVNEYKITAVVKSVDHAKRSLVLLMPNGETKDFTVSAEAVNFPQVKVGDEVKASYIESLAVNVLGPGEKLNAEESTTVALAPKGAKPGGLVANTKTITAKVTEIDYKTRMVTLTGPEGNSLTFEAGPDVKRLNDVKKDDTVTIRYTEAIAVDVVPTGKSAPPAAGKK